MTNIHQLFNPRITTATRTDNFARKVVERLHNPISVKPSQVTRDPELAAEIAQLESHGWRVDSWTDGRDTCTHPRIHTIPNKYFTVAEAQAWQVLLWGWRV